MNESLRGTLGRASYPRLLQIADNEGLDSTLRVIRDGQGDASALSLSRTAARVSGDFSVIGTASIPYQAPSGLSRDIALHLSESMRHATDYGVPNDGVADASAAMKAFVELCDYPFFPAGDYLIDGAGSDAGGIEIVLTKTTRIVCHPDARFIAGKTGNPLDNNMITFVPPSGGAGLPAEKIEVSWIGGYFDQRNQCVSTSVPFLTEYPPPAGLAGASGTCDALSFKLSYSIDGVGYEAARSTYVGDVTFYAGAHWETAGGDSGIFMGGGTGQGRVERCHFYGSRDLGVYSSGVASGRQGATVRDCYFESCFGGVSFKRGQSGFILSGNTFRNCVVAMASSPLTRVSERGVASGNILIGCGIGFRFSASDANEFFGNQVLSLGAFRADGTTTVAPYGFSCIVWLSGASRNRIIMGDCGPKETGFTGDSYGVLMRDNSSNVSSENYIEGVLTTDYGSCVTNDGTGINNQIVNCYNFGTIGVSNPLPGADYVIRRDVTNAAPIYRSPLEFANGSASAPIISRESQSNTGLYFDTSLVGISTNGVSRFDVNTARALFALPVQFPIYTTTARNALASPQAGWTIWNTTTGALETYNGSAWV